MKVVCLWSFPRMYKVSWKSLWNKWFYLEGFRDLVLNGNRKAAWYASHFHWLCNLNWPCLEARFCFTFRMSEATISGCRSRVAFSYIFPQCSPVVPHFLAPKSTQCLVYSRGPTPISSVLELDSDASSPEVTWTAFISFTSGSKMSWTGPIQVEYSLF